MRSTAVASRFADPPWRLQACPPGRPAGRRDAPARSPDVDHRDATKYETPKPPAQSRLQSSYANAKHVADADSGEQDWRSQRQFTCQSTCPGVIPIPADSITAASTPRCPVQVLRKMGAARQGERDDCRACADATDPRDRYQEANSARLGIVCTILALQAPALHRTAPHQCNSQGRPMISASPWPELPVRCARPSFKHLAAVSQQKIVPVHTASSSHAPRKRRANARASGSAECGIPRAHTPQPRRPAARSAMRAQKALPARRA